MLSVLQLYIGLVSHPILFFGVKISLISYFLSLLLLVFICILDLAHTFFIINIVSMCILYTREINLKSYFLYSKYGIGV